MELKEKETFFALYWGQNVHTDECYSGKEGFTPFVVDPQNSYGWLELKSLEDITDEDAIEVAKLDKRVDWHTGRKSEVFKNSFGVTFVSNGSGHITKYGQTIVGDSKYLNPAQYDFLRSNGYALDWTNSEGRTYTVAELVAEGVVKLRKPVVN